MQSRASLVVLALCVSHSVSQSLKSCTGGSCGGDDSGLALLQMKQPKKQVEKTLVDDPPEESDVEEVVEGDADGNQDTNEDEEMAGEKEDYSTDAAHHDVRAAAAFGAAGAP